MYFYHEGYHDAHSVAATEDMWARERRDDELDYEPIRIPAILNWLVVVSAAMCVIFAAIQALS